MDMVGSRVLGHQIASQNRGDTMGVSPNLTRSFPVKAAGPLEPGETMVL